tara:strand:+ start:2481 stop:2612 length:132 start_codon:yes stop_codon:yes gene_type:complete
MKKNNVIPLPELLPIDKQFLKLSKQQQEILEQQEKIKVLLGQK